MKKEDKAAYESNIWKLYLTSFIGNLEFVSPVFVLFLLANQLTMTQVFLLQSLFTVIIFIMEVPSGVAADLFGRKQTLALSYLFICMGFIIYGISSTFPFFIIAETFIALSWALYSGTDSAFVYDTLKELKREKQFKKIMGNIAACLMLGLGLASLPGGYLGELLGYRSLFFIGAFFFFIGFLFCLSLTEPKHYKKAEDTHFFKHLREGFSYAGKNQQIRKYIIYFSLIAAFVWLLFFFVPPYFEEQGYSVTVIGLIVGFGLLFQAAGYYFTEKISNKIKHDDAILLWILFITALGFILLFFVPPLVALVTVLCLSFLNAIKEVISDHAIHQQTPSSHRATILSVKSMGKNIMFAIFGPILGYATELYDIKTTLLSMGVILFVFLVYILFLFYFTKEEKKENHKKNTFSKK
ncbi:MFS transporter [Candidatus Woesearchaeota archaeon]|nr:MFS transporter [Candidatus Woesearchaeota archaeon]